MWRRCHALRLARLPIGETLRHKTGAVTMLPAMVHQHVRATPSLL
jgi:hypothetical protein